MLSSVLNYLIGKLYLTSINKIQTKIIYLFDTVLRPKYLLQTKHPALINRCFCPSSRIAICSNLTRQDKAKTNR